MKKIFLLALLLGLTGCGNDNQNGASQADSSSGLGGQTVAKTMSASSLPLGGWAITNTSTLGASTVLDGAKDTRISTALITPNATDVAKVLRGGAAGIALSIAVEQLLGAVDWVLDPANNQIRYKPKNPDEPNPTDPLLPYYYISPVTNKKYPRAEDACDYLTVVNNGKGIPGASFSHVSYENNRIFCYYKWNGGIYSWTYVDKRPNPAYNPNTSTLPLETVAQQVISNADDEDLDAQVATKAAAQTILTEAYNDAVKAQPIVDQLENNANNNCKKHDFNMDSKASYVSLRYDELYEDRYDLYNQAYGLDNPLIVNGKSKGSWVGHIQRYQSAKVDLRSAITKAGNDQCPPTPRASRWINKSPPPQPHVHSPG